MKIYDVYLFINKLDVALVNADRELIEDLLTPEAKFKHVTGVVQSRDEWVNCMTDGTFKYRDVYSDNVNIEVTDSGYKVKYDWTVIEKSVRYYRQEIVLKYKNKKLLWDGINNLSYRA